MARRPRTGGAVATAHQGGRPQLGLRHLLRRAVALGGGLLLRPLRMIWRVLLPYRRSRNARSARAAAAMARRHWRADAPPRGTPLLRRAMAHAIGAVHATLLPVRRSLAVSRDVVRHLHPWGACQRPRAEAPLPPAAFAGRLPAIANGGTAAAATAAAAKAQEFIVLWAASPSSFSCHLAAPTAFSSATHFRTSFFFPSSIELESCKSKLSGCYSKYPVKFYWTELFFRLVDFLAID